MSSAIVTAMFGKGISVLVGFATIPLTVRYLGPEGFGLWATISSAIIMFFSLDLGIASTLTNLISEAYSENDHDKAAKCFATAFWLVVGISAMFGIAGLLMWPFINWTSVFHVQDLALARDTSHAMAASFIVFLLALPTNLASKVMAGYQDLHIYNLFLTGGSVTSFGVVIFVISHHGSLAMLVGGFSGSSVAANAACLLWVCLAHRPWIRPSFGKIRREYVGKIFHAGSHFFVIQLAGMVVFNSDNLVISHFLSPAQVTPYSVTWRLVGYIGTIQALVIPALWPAYAEAYARGHLSWIRSTYYRIRRISITILVPGCVVLLALGRVIIRLWAGTSAVPSLLLVELMCVWVVIVVFTTNQSTLMGATSRVGKQAISSSLAAGVNFTLSVLWVKKYGTIGVISATIVSYLIFIVLVQAWEVSRILRGAFLPADMTVS